MTRHNETLRILSEASVSVAPPTLDSLLADEKRDFALESSEPRFTPSAPMSRRSPANGTETRLRRLDWNDDDLPTTQPEPLGSRRQSEPPE